MSIRRKSTTHDLATLRLHPDGSRVQQSSVNTRRRTATSTVVDARGNWIANDAGGKSWVKKRRRIGHSRASDADDELIDLSSYEERAPSQSKGKQRARDSETPNEDLPGSEGLDTRTKQRLSFAHDLSFLDPPLVAVSSLEQDTEHASATTGESFVSFPDPAPDLLKAIHHFASCYYLERGQLSNSSRNYRGEKKERHKQPQQSNHILAANTAKHQNIDSESEPSDTDNESTEDQKEVVDTEGSGKETNVKADTYRKDMYKAFDGSALMAIGIVLQEYVAYTLLLVPHTVDDPGSDKRRRVC